MIVSSFVIIVVFFILKAITASILIESQKSKESNEYDHLDADLEAFGNQVFEENQLPILDYIIQRDNIYLSSEASNYLKPKSILASMIQPDNLVDFYQTDMERNCNDLLNSKMFNIFTISYICLNTAVMILATKAETQMTGILSLKANSVLTLLFFSVESLLRAVVYKS